jgi:DNA mismatch repair protein MSH2
VQVIGAPTLFATHFHELTSIKGVVGVQNSHMQTSLDLQSSKLTMLYKVVDGACDQSFGIHVAEFAGFPQEVVENAKQRLAELEAGGLPNKQAQVNSAAHSAIVPLSTLAATIDMSLLQVGEKRPREEEAAGSEQAAETIKKFLKDFTELPLSTDDGEARKQLDTLKQGLVAAASENPALKALLATVEGAA